MIRSRKRLAIFFYVLCIIGVALNILEIIKSGIDFNAIWANMIFVVWGIPGYFEYRAYKRKITKYNELLKENKLKRIEYSIDTIHTVKGRAYTVVFYINEEKCRMSFPEYGCRNNNNYEYYLEPIYKKNGEFKDFIVHADKSQSDEKCMNYTDDIREYEEKIAKSRGQKDKWDKYINSKM